MIRKILAYFGYYPIDYGYACGRHWVAINGKVFAHVFGDYHLNDDDVQRIVYLTIDHGKHWRMPTK